MEMAKLINILNYNFLLTEKPPKDIVAEKEMNEKSFSNSGSRCTL